MMMVLVTGGSGYLGRRVVSALCRRGLRVRALDRVARADPHAEAYAEARGVEDVEHLTGDVTDPAVLASACRGAGCVVHLAALLSGPDAEVERVAEDGTRRLLQAMAAARVPRLVLASSLSVYAASCCSGVREEDAPLEQALGDRDAYTRAKLAQERIARELGAAHGIGLTVLRPGMLWGPGRDDPPTAGFRLGPLRVVVAPSRQLPLVHVDNCGDAFAAAVEAQAIGTFDVIDHPEVTVARYLRDRRRGRGGFEVALSAPYGASRAAVAALYRLTPPRLRSRLPGFAGPARFAARYAPVQVPGRRFREQTGWKPPLSYQECLDVTFGEA